MSDTTKKGEQIILKIGNKLLAGISSHDFDFSRDMLETTDMNTPAGTRTYTAGRGGSTISVEGLHKPGEASKDDFFTLLAACQAGNEIIAYRGSTTVGEKYLSMNVLISGVANKAADNQVANYSCNLQVTGAVTIVTVT
jgi:predicted secreted protein